jgi:hypothetical protein
MIALKQAKRTRKTKKWRTAKIVESAGQRKILKFPALLSFQPTLILKCKSSISHLLFFTLPQSCRIKNIVACLAVILSSFNTPTLGRVRVCG